MKDGLICFYFHYREYIVVATALLVVTIGVALLVFQPILFLNIFFVTMAAIVVVVLLLFIVAGAWMALDRLMPADPRKQKEESDS